MRRGSGKAGTCLDIHIKVPAALRRHIVDSAERNERSIHAEIVYRLKRSIEADKEAIKRG